VDRFCNSTHFFQNDLSFEADAETLSLFTSLDFALDDNSAANDDSTDAPSAANSGPGIPGKSCEQPHPEVDDLEDEDDDEDEEEDEEEEEEEETAVSLVHSVQPSGGKKNFDYNIYYIYNMNNIYYIHNKEYIYNTDSIYYVHLPTTTSLALLKASVFVKLNTLVMFLQLLAL
jgi:hypothetical protein